MMSRSSKWMALLGSAALMTIPLTSSGLAGPDEDTLIIDGETIATEAPAPEGSSVETLYSGWRFRSDETQQLQMDDFENPAFAAVDLGEALWATEEGAAGKSCATCHEDAGETMKGVRASYPKWDEERGKPHTLETQINECREERMEAEPWKWEAEEMLAMTAFVGLQSRGMPVKVQTDGPMLEWAQKGEKLYNTRIGQLNMACANCHEDNWGNNIRSDHLSQGQTNGFPVYRLKWAGLGSIHRRFKGCMENIRAEPYERGSDEFIALELYVASRGQGLSVETPSVRN